MENKLFFEALEPYRDIIINAKLRGINSLIQHNENTYKPEMKECFGYSQAEYLGRLEQKKEKLIHEQQQGYPLQYMDISKAEALNYLRADAADMRRTANQFPQNHSMRWNFYRKAIKIAQTMIQVEPRLEMYSLHWIINATPIHLN